MVGRLLVGLGWVGLQLEAGGGVGVSGDGAGTYGWRGGHWVGVDRLRQGSAMSVRFVVGTGDILCNSRYGVRPARVRVRVGLGRRVVVGGGGVCWIVRV